MSNSRPMIFKSVDARKQNPQNKPGKFTVKFTPELFLEVNERHFIVLDHLSMTASWHNIRPEYENNKLVITKDGGTLGKQSLFQLEFMIMSILMSSFTKRLESLAITITMEFLFYLIYQLTKFSYNWQLAIRLISRNREISMFFWDLTKNCFLQ